MNLLDTIPLSTIHGRTKFDNYQRRIIGNVLPDLFTYDAIGANREPNLNNHPPMKPITTMPY